MDLIFKSSQNSDDVDALSRDSVAMMIYKCLHSYYGSEREWICNAIDSSLEMDVDIRRQGLNLRIPATLEQPGLISELRSGEFLWDLRRFDFMSCMRLIVENTLDSILAGNELIQESLSYWK